MDIVNVYLNLQDRLAIAKETAKIKARYNELLNLPLKPRADIMNNQKEAYQKYLEPIYYDIDDFQLEITQLLLECKQKQITINQSDCIEELYEWKKNAYSTIEKAGDELINCISNINTEFQKVKNEIDVKAKEILNRHTAMNGLDKGIKLQQKRFITKINKLEKKVQLAYEKLNLMRLVLVPEKIQVLYSVENMEKRFDFSKKVRRIVRLNWVKQRIRECDLELDLLINKEFLRKRREKANDTDKESITQIVEKTIKKKGPKKSIHSYTSILDDKDEEEDDNNEINIKSHEVKREKNTKKDIREIKLKEMYDRIMEKYKVQEKENEESDRLWYEEMRGILNVSKSINNMI